MHTRRPGVTLLELTIAIGVIAITLALAAPPLTHARDVLAVRAARDAIVAAAARTRAMAIQHGGALLRIDPTSGAITITGGDGTLESAARIAGDIEVRVLVQGSQSTEALIQYDALGIGRLANRTISLSRGRSSGGVTFSAYGRPRPW